MTLVSHRKKHSGIDAQSDHMHFAPMLRSRDAHQLAPAKVADTYDELRVFDLLPKIELLHIVELVRPMHGKRIRKSPGRRRKQSHGRYRSAEMNVQLMMTTRTHQVAHDKRLCEVKER